MSHGQFERVLGRELNQLVEAFQCFDEGRYDPELLGPKQPEGPPPPSKEKGQSSTQSRPQPLAQLLSSALLRRAQAPRPPLCPGKHCVPTTTYYYNDLLRLQPTATDYHDLCL